VKLLGVVLIALGALGLAYGGVSIWRRETVLDVGPIHATREKKETLPIPPIVGGLAVAAGVVLLLGSKSGKS
jgi:hypothetical protein